MDSEEVSLPLIHEHPMMPWNDMREGDCCGSFETISDGFYCKSCDFFVHKKCGESSEFIEHPCHSIHTLQLLMGSVPDYSDGRCCLCGRNIEDKLFYRCSSCNFCLDMHCVSNPPPKSLMDLKAHDHQLTLLPRLFSFTCNACGLRGDRSPYLCFHCDFMIHLDCLGLPSVIKINRHDHNVSRTSVVGVVNSGCGVCRQKMDSTYGGYSCQRCPDYFVHYKCATRIDVWDEKELEGVPEEIEDIEPYVVLDDNTIQHFSHKEHYLRLHDNGVLWEEENKRCRACTHPIGFQSFYGCIDCDFILHRTCAGIPRKIWHVLSNKRLTLVTSEANVFSCYACHNISNGFRYQCADMVLDVLCGTIREPFNHPSHDHPLYYIPQYDERKCNGCNESSSPVLMCIEGDCDFVLDFKCATLPQVVKHSTYDDHPFSLCFGKEASGKDWCDICGKESDLKTWFYTCKDQVDSLHTNCVVGDFSGLMPTSTIEVLNRPFEVVLNNSVSRPFCRWCKSHCIYAIMLKMLGTSDTYVCSNECLYNVLDPSYSD